MGERLLNHDDDRRADLRAQDNSRDAQRGPGRSGRHGEPALGALGEGADQRPHALQGDCLAG